MEDLDIYEVDKEDYDAYFFRLPKNENMKTTPREGLTIYKDITTSTEICGILSEKIMGLLANRYFIFNFLEEERLGPPKTYINITMTEDEYKDFIGQLSRSAKKNG